MRKRIPIFTVGVLFIIWITIYTIDYTAVICEQNPPVFCIPNKNGYHYSGLGYSYDIIVHPVTGEPEYVQYFLGVMIRSNMTN